MSEKQYHTDQIAILLATYNGEKYIKDQIQSILEQTYTQWVLFIHDDGSKDATTQIIAEYQKQYSEKIVVVDGPKTGSAKSNFFYLISQVTAPYIMFCDQDDVWKKDKIKKTIEHMRKLENRETEVPCLVFTELSVVDENLNVISEIMSSIQQLDCNRLTTKDLMVQNSVTGCTMMINAALLAKSQIPADYEQIIMHDWWIAMIAAEYGRIAFVKEPTIYYRQHGGNSVGAKQVNTFGYVIQKLSKIQDIKNSLELTRRQAAEFARVFGIENSLITEYSQIRKYRKLKRLRFYSRNKISKSGLLRNIGFVIWG